MAKKCELTGKNPMKGHNTYRKDCRINETKKIIKKYIEEQG